VCDIRREATRLFAQRQESIEKEKVNLAGPNSLRAPVEIVKCDMSTSHLKELPALETRFLEFCPPEIRLRAYYSGSDGQIAQFRNGGFCSFYDSQRATVWKSDRKDGDTVLPTTQQSSYNY